MILSFIVQRIAPQTLTKDLIFLQRQVSLGFNILWLDKSTCNSNSNLCQFTLLCVRMGKKERVQFYYFTWYFLSLIYINEKHHLACKIVPQPILLMINITRHYVYRFLSKFFNSPTKLINNKVVIKKPKKCQIMINNWVETFNNTKQLLLALPNSWPHPSVKKCLSHNHLKEPGMMCINFCLNFLIHQQS